MESNPSEAKLPIDFESMPKERKEAYIRAFAEALKPVFAEAIGPHLRAAIGGALEDAGFSGRVLTAATQLSEKWDEDREKVFLKALALYQAAREADAEGNHLVIVNGDDDIIQDVTGLRTHDPVAKAGA